MNGEYGLIGKVSEAEKSLAEAENAHNTVKQELEKLFDPGQEKTA